MIKEKIKKDKELNDAQKRKDLEKYFKNNKIRKRDRLMLKIHFEVATPTEVYDYIKEVFLNYFLNEIDNLKKRIKKLELKGG